MDENKPSLSPNDMLSDEDRQANKAKAINQRNEANSTSEQDQPEENNLESTKKIEMEPGWYQVRNAVIYPEGLGGTGHSIGGGLMLIFKDGEEEFHGFSDASRNFGFPVRGWSRDKFKDGKMTCSTSKNSLYPNMMLEADVEWFREPTF